MHTTSCNIWSTQWKCCWPLYCRFDWENWEDNTIHTHGWIEGREGNNNEYQGALWQWCNGEFAVQKCLHINAGQPWKSAPIITYTMHGERVMRTIGREMGRRCLPWYPNGEVIIQSVPQWRWVVTPIWETPPWTIQGCAQLWKWHYLHTQRQQGKWNHSKFHIEDTQIPHKETCTT